VTGDLLPKLLGVQESHGGLPGYYLALAPLTFWPGVVLAPFGLIWAWRHRHEPGPRFCLAWLIPAWLALELIPTKLAHYVLPLYPALALLAAAAAIKGRDQLTAFLGRWPARAWALLWCLAGLTLAGLVPAAAHFATGTIPALAWAPAAAALLGILAGIAGIIKGDGRVMVLGPALAMVLFTGLIFAASGPAISQLWPARGVQALVGAHQSPDNSPIPVAAVGFHEPSLVFALGTATVLTQAEGAAQHLARKPGALALIEARRDAKFRAALAQLGVDVVALGTVRGFNLSKGKEISLTLYRAGPRNP
jgi:4-amino-4-deoxy-L-arabinose transferase-like glycosyltransferase